MEVSDGCHQVRAAQCQGMVVREPACDQSQPWSGKPGISGSETCQKISLRRESKNILTGSYFDNLIDTDNYKFIQQTTFIYPVTIQIFNDCVFLGKFNLLS